MRVHVGIALAAALGLTGCDSAQPPKGTPQGSEICLKMQHPNRCAWALMRYHKMMADRSERRHEHPHSHPHEHPIGGSE